MNTSSKAKKHLIVDGFNIAHHLLSSKKFLKKGDLASAIEKVWTTIIVLHDHDDIRITIVFDGQGKQIQIERPTKDPSFSLVFTPAEFSADGLILQLVQNAKAKDSIIVASNDSSIQTIVRAQGATAISASDLICWSELAQQRFDQKLKQQQRQNDQEWKNSNNWNILE